MIIKKMKIKKFRGVENVEFDFLNSLNAFSGENGIGKTTLLDSILWVLCDETLICGKTNSSNLDDNDIKAPLEVELDLVKADGSELILKRNYYAKFNNDVFDDYVNKFSINDANYSVSDYFKRIKQELGLQNEPIVKGFNILRCLIDFDYFGSIDYKIAREVIENVLKLESAGDIINKEKYFEIKNDLIGQNYDISKTKTMYNTQKKNKEYEIDKIKNEMNVLKDNIKPLNKTKYENLKNDVEEVKIKEYEHSVEYKKIKKEFEDFSNDVQLTYNELMKLKNDYRTLEIKNANVLNPLETKNKELENLRTQFIKVKASATKCPKCDFVLNENDIVKQLTEISNRGKKLNNEIEELKKLIKTDELNILKNNISLKEEEYNNLLNKQNELKSQFTSLIEKEDLESQNFYKAKQERLDALKEEIYKMELESNKKPLEDKEQELEKSKVDLAKLELKTQLLIEFEKDKIYEISKKVNTVFPNIEFILTEVSNKGAELKTCKATYNGVDYLRLNDGQKIKLGLEIIDDFNRYLGILDPLPVVFDKMKDLSNSSITSILDNFKFQIFTTFVDNNTKIVLHSK